MPTPDFAHSTALPVLIGLPSGPGTDVPPDVVPGAVVGFTAAAPVATPLANTRPTSDTPRLHDYTTIIPPADDQTMQTPTLTFAGQLVVGQSFGIYRAPLACVIQGIQLAAQVAPVGAPVVVELVDDAGALLGGQITLPAGDSWSQVTLALPITVLPGGVIRGKVTAVGSTKPGSFLTATLIIQTVTV